MTYLVVGLGNPGPRYESTPHNAGFMAVDALATELGIDVRQSWAEARIGLGWDGERRVALAKPQTFMNESGRAVAALLPRLDVDLAHLIVVYDDVDLEPGILRVRPRGSAGTHNGMRSIVGQLGSEAFARVRIGIGSPPPGGDLAAWVLRPLSGEALALQRTAAQAAARAVRCFLAEGIDAAMRRYNGPAAAI